MTSLSFSAIDSKAPFGIPPPKPNGGLYTGEPFRAGAPWANVPVTPDSLTLQRETLRSADPPPPAEVTERQYAYDLRPGNNSSHPISYESLGFSPYQHGWSTWAAK